MRPLIQTAGTTSDATTSSCVGMGNSWGGRGSKVSVVETSRRFRVFVAVRVPCKPDAVLRKCRLTKDGPSARLGCPVPHSSACVFWGCTS